MIILQGLGTRWLITQGYHPLFIETVPPEIQVSVSAPSGPTVGRSLSGITINVSFPGRVTVGGSI